MKRKSTAISLALLSSGAILLGCDSSLPRPTSTATTPHGRSGHATSHRHRGWGVWGWGAGRGVTAGGSSPASSPSRSSPSIGGTSRGGFGSSGHAVS